MATSLDKSEKGVQIDHLQTNTYYLIVEIGPVDPEIGLIGLQEIVKRGKKKLMQAKYITQLNKNTIK